MQELISQVEELGIEINHTTSLVMIFGIILSPPLLFTLFCTGWYYAHLKTRQHQFPSVVANYHAEQIIPPPAFTLQGIIVNIQATLWLQKAVTRQIY